MGRSETTAQELWQKARLMYDNGDRHGAIRMFEIAIRADPKHYLSWADRGAALHNTGHYFDALLNYERACDLAPDEAHYHNNRGVSLIEMMRYSEALDAFLHAIRVNPELPEAYYNAANTYAVIGRPEDALSAYAMALHHRQNYPDAKLQRSLCLLRMGRFKEGWQEFEARWHSGQLYLQNVRRKNGKAVPYWNGEKLDGKKLLLWGEQGFGDVIQFCRYASLIKERWKGATVDIEASLPVARLLRSLENVDRVFTIGEVNLKQCDYDFNIPMCSLPRIFGTDLETIPAKIPYLQVKENVLAHYKDIVDKDLANFKDRLRVGICWAGGERPFIPAAMSIDRRRSTHLHQWAKVAMTPGVVWVSLQKGQAAAQINPPPMGMTVSDHINGCHDFLDTAALIKQLDLVISVDTAIPHLSAALGVETWLLSRYDSCWRWLWDRKDSPWYPGVLRHYKQEQPGGWPEVFDRVAEDLVKITSKRFGEQMKLPPYQPMSIMAAE